MNKEENTIKYYILITKLKNVIRTGWKVWHIDRQRIESVAEHIYSTQNLAIAIATNFKRTDINLARVVMMLAVHELEEIIIGDIPMPDMSREEKASFGHKAVEKILGTLIDAEDIKNLIFEFDERKTNDAKFAYLCDKLDCDLMAKIYDEEGCIDLFSEENKGNYEKYRVEEKIAAGAKTYSDVWLMGDENIYTLDEDFMRVFKYAKNHKILSLISDDFYNIN